MFDDPGKKLEGEWIISSRDLGLQMAHCSDVCFDGCWCRFVRDGVVYIVSGDVMLEAKT